MEFYIYTDGASRGNPGESASGYYVFDKDYRLVLKKVFYNGVKTNNFAEYNAILNALKKVSEDYGFENEVEVISDSEVAVKQINGLYKVKNEALRPLNREVKSIAKRFKKCTFRNVARENKYVSAVDRDLNRLLDKIKKDESKIYKGGKEEEKQKKL
ncbi:MAG: ribonuclease HI family protein [Candidatus Micrarchaeia archaeon]